MIKTPTPSEIFISVIKSAFSLLTNHPLIQYSWIFPFLWVYSYFFGFWNTWVTLIGVTMIYLIKSLAYQKRELYEALLKVDKGSSSSSVQKCNWVNLLIRKYWISCLPKLLEPVIEEQRAKLEAELPKYLNFKFGEIFIGKISPQVDKIITFHENTDSNYTMDCLISFLPETSVEIFLSPYNLFKMRFLIHELKFIGRVRVKFQLNNLFPELSTIGVSFVDHPSLEVAIKPNGKVDVISLPFIYHWAYDIVNRYLDQMMVYPKCLLFTMGGGDIDTNLEEPITDIVLFHPAPESRVPKGYFLLQRTSGGNIAANFNYRNPGNPVFLCYKRGGEAAPITELAIILPGCGEVPPDGFFALEHTFNNEYGSLNTGSDSNDEIFLCYSRDPSKGKPITGLTLFNSEEGLQEMKNYSKIELTPSGYSANINRDERKKLCLYLGYKGGCTSPFGYMQKCMDVQEGVLRVSLTSGRNLMIADVGGTSDPYCKLMLIKEKNFADPIKVQTSKIIPKNLNPYWGETFYFNNCRRSDLLLVKCFDHDLVGSDDYLGTVCVSLANLVVNKPVDQWFTLQHVEHGDIRMKITSINFGITSKSRIHGSDVINNQPIIQTPSKPLLTSKYSFQNVHSANEQTSPSSPSLSSSSSNLNQSSNNINKINQSSGDLSLSESSASLPNFNSISSNNNNGKGDHHKEEGVMMKEVKLAVNAKLNKEEEVEEDEVDEDNRLISPLLQIAVPEKDVVDKFQDAVGTVGEVGIKVGEKGIKTVAAVGDIGVRAVGSFFKTLTRDRSKKEYEKRCADIEKETSEGGEYASIEGFLEQRASNHITWSSRYFVLKNYILTCYKKSKAEESPKKIKLVNANVVFQNSENVFKLTTEDGVVFRLRAADEETTFKWYRALSRNIRISKEGRFARKQ